MIKNRHYLFLLFFLSFSSPAENLVSIYNQAIRADATFLVAISTRNATREIKPQTRALLFPKISASAYTNKKRTRSMGNSQNYSNSGYSLDLTQPLYNKQSKYAKRKADYALLQADALLQQAHADLVLRIADSYFAALEAQDKLNLTKQEEKALKAQHHKIQQEFNVEFATITDLNEAKARYDLAVSNRLFAETELDISKENISVIVGSRPRTLDKLKSKIATPRPNPADVRQWLKTALSANPRLKAQNMNTKSAREEIALQRAARNPYLDLNVNKSKTNSGRDGFANEDNQSIGLTLTIPIYQGGVISSKTREARHNSAAAKSNMVQVRREIESLVRNYYQSVISDIKLIQAAKQAVKSSASALAAAQAGVEADTRTTLDVMNARSEMFSAKFTLAQSRYKYLLDGLRLKNAAGVLGVADLQKTNRLLR